MSNIKKVAVIGSGVMGSGIACHLANIGLDVLLLDILPGDANDKNRNAVADVALAAAIKSKPAPLYDKAFANRIHTGNIEDDLSKVAEVDWIIEVIVEKAGIKKQLFQKVDAFRRPGTLITSNTSGIPISILADGRSDDFKSHFCGTHFFNPARYMSLLEIIPHQGTDPSVIDFFMHFGDIYLGKKTVLCKDTPAFIANRIGFFSGTKVIELTEKYDLNITEVDKLTGALIDWPSTGSFRLFDLVGIDTSMKVTQGVITACPKDEYVQKVNDKPNPKFVDFLLENKFFGNKTGQGYYKKTNEMDANGRRVILALDLNTLEYKPTEKPTLPSLAIGKKIELLDKRLEALFASDDKGGQFLREYFAGLLSYTSHRLTEIADFIYSIDDAMKAGYAWGKGPFEYWDAIGIQKGVDLMKEYGHNVPEWIQEMLEEGVSGFYKIENGTRYYYDINAREYFIIPGSIDIIHLDNYRSQTPILINSECLVHDLGDGVMNLEFTSKANAIGEGIGEGLMQAVQLCEDDGWNGLVIGNNAKNFTVGANLMAVGMLAMQKQFDKLEEMVDGFQQVNMRLRTSKIPVVTATQGYVFGGGCEILMHTDSALCAAESYIGLVEVGVGLIPGGGGTKELALRASDSYFEGDTQMPTLIEKLRAIATASVGTSAYEALNLGYLQDNRDSIEVNTSRVLQRAKQRVLNLAEKYTPPSEKQVTVLGRAGLATLYTAINEFYLGKYMSDYDVEVSRKVAYILCGGDLTAQQQVSEQYLLDLEREAFLALLGNQKTLDRIQYMLMNNKPLRN
jgi:3-hydroxyacyl-CoA dehydrogenase